MTEVKTINIRFNETDFHDVEALFERMGLNVDTAVAMFFKQCLADRAIPFQPKDRMRYLPQNEKVSAVNDKRFAMRELREIFSPIQNMDIDLKQLKLPTTETFSL